MPYDGRSPLQARGSEQRVLVQFARPALGDLRNARSMGAAEQRKHIDSLKREAITTRSALAANGVVLRDVVAFYRVWNGFAATVQHAGPAAAELAAACRCARSGAPIRPPASRSRCAEKPTLKPAGLNGQPPVAVLDTGIDSGALGGHADPGYDAVDRDRDPRPGATRAARSAARRAGPRWRASSPQAGERVLPIRIASLRAAGGAAEASSTTDQIIAGLEHAVDPNGDQDTSDHVPVALIGVNAPYAGFSDTPEAQAISGAAGLGHADRRARRQRGRGGARQRDGRLARERRRDALAVGALAGPRARAAHRAQRRRRHARQAAVLAGSAAEAAARPPARSRTPTPRSSAARRRASAARS